MFSDTYVPEGAKNQGAELLRKFADAPKYGYFFNPLPHGTNISTLATLADPFSVPKALPTFGKLLRADPEKRYGLLKDVIQGGAIGVDKLDRGVPGWIGKMNVGGVYEALGKPAPSWAIARRRDVISIALRTKRCGRSTTL